MDTVGGIAGAVEGKINGSTADVKTITGVRGVGGIAGKTSKEIAGCTAIIETIDYGEIPEKDLASAIMRVGFFEVHLGGIAGWTDANIIDSAVEINQIGTKDTVKFHNRTTNSGIIRPGGNNSYIVGGIAGYTKGHIKNTKINQNKNAALVVKGAAVYGSSLQDHNALLAVGGYVGYRDSGKSVNGDTDGWNQGWNNKSIVSGYDNVGGMIGYNVGGSISNIEFKESATGAGENIGGIIGLNRSCTITMCTNSGTVTGIGEISDSFLKDGLNDIGDLARGKNRGTVGGIVGLNYYSNIEKCKNVQKIKGKCNTGGIIGVSYGGTIKSCQNSGIIEGEKNKHNILGSVDIFNLVESQIGRSTSTATGGIIGKGYDVTIEKSGNTGDVTCNFNGGGIVGIYIGAGSHIEYCYNRGNIKATNIENRIGGICGAADNIKIYGCYNVGKIEGKQGSDIHERIGGILGFCVDNGLRWDNSKEKLFPDNKYLSGLEITIIGFDGTRNQFSYCYNAGEVVGTTKNLLTGKVEEKDRPGIIGYINFDLFKKVDDEVWVTITECYYSGNGDGAIYWVSSFLNFFGETTRSGITQMSDNDLKKHLYNWANAVTVKPEYGEDAGKYVFNTTAPVETGYGFNGYGALWWELEPWWDTSVKYLRSIIHVYDNIGSPIYPPTLYINNNSNSVLLDSSYRKEGNPYYCSEIDTETHTYILMLNKNQEYQAWAKHSSYKEETDTKTIIKPNNYNAEYDVYIGRRPIFLIAVETSDTTWKKTTTVPPGDYYVIATAGGGSGPAKGLVEYPGGGSGAGYVGILKLETEQEYSFSVGARGDATFWDGNDGTETCIKQGDKTLLKLGPGYAGGYDGLLAEEYVGKGRKCNNNTRFEHS